MLIPYGPIIHSCFRRNIGNQKLEDTCQFQAPAVLSSLISSTVAFLFCWTCLLLPRVDCKRLCCCLTDYWIISRIVIRKTVLNVVVMQPLFNSEIEASSMYWRRASMTAKRPQAPSDATVRKRVFRNNFVIFRRRLKGIAFLESLNFSRCVYANFNFCDGHVTTFRHRSGACQMPGHRLSRPAKGTPSESRLFVGTTGLG